MKIRSKFATRRMVLRQTLLAAGAALVYSSNPGTKALAQGFVPAAGSASRPDIVFVVADDLSWTDIEPNGSPDARTPHMAKLARDGLLLSRAFSSSPTCTPSRSSMLTGDYPIRNGAHANHSNIKPGTKTLPHYLKTLGYRVVIAGKTDIGPPYAFPFEYLGGSTFHPDAAKANLLSHLDTTAVDRLFATRDPDVPLALFTASYQPHVPWASDATYDPASLTLPPNTVDTPETRNARASYLTDVSDLDRELGDIRKSIEEHGDTKNTLLVFTGDHGAQFPFAKWNLYDPGIHIPLIVTWPGQIPADQTSNALVSLVDLLPTMIEAAGGTAPEGIDGKSFMPVLTGRENDFHDAIFAAHTGDLNHNRSPMRAIRTDRWKLILNLNPDEKYVNALTENNKDSNYWDSWVEKAKTDPGAAALVTRYQHRPPIELYDLAVNPEENRNLAGDPKYDTVMADLRQRLDAWRSQQGEKAGDVPMPQDALFGEHQYAEWAN